MGISASPGASGGAKDDAEDEPVAGDMNVDDSFLSRVRLCQGGDFTVALLVVVGRGASDENDRLHRRRTRILP